ncbi:MAG: NAD-dependent epimerase/dehydratase family protein [Fibromonadaceae bacterium]|jgi:dTDP-glucose 4,6-dehydratase|nr:NAD-dependent epimerase/dehydratase family protein [Fibromonadaceae bacterium]
MNDLEYIANSNVPWECFENKTFFVTGATGLLGSILIKGLLAKKQNIRIIALARNKDKVAANFKPALIESKELSFIYGDVAEKLKIDEPIDYIVHGANPTASKEFVNHPVETIKTIYNGTLNTLELAREKSVKGYLYLSSMEVYMNLDTTSVRNCYPEGKRLAENLCTSYFYEYKVNTKIARLAQTFGAGIDIENDNRVFAQFARCAKEKRDIVLRTKADTVRSYCYTTDAVTAMLWILAKGKGGDFYDVASKVPPVSIRDMAECFGKVVFDIAENSEKLGYPPAAEIILDTAKLEGLGWEPDRSIEKGGIKEMCGRVRGNL